MPEFREYKGSAAVAIVSFRRILFYQFGAPWLGLLAAAHALAYRVQSPNAGTVDAARAGFLLVFGFIVSVFIAILGPVFLDGRSARASIRPWMSVLPVGPFARSFGAAAGSAAAALAVMSCFIVSILQFGGAPALRLSQQLRIMNAEVAEMRAPGSEVSLIISDPREFIIKLAPRIGFSWGYGDPDPAEFRVETKQQNSTADFNIQLRSRKAAWIGGRDGATPWRGGDGDVLLKITKKDGPLVFWPEGSISLESPPMGWAEFLVSYYFYVALSLFILAAAGAACAAALEGPFAAAAGATIVFITFAAPPPWMGQAMGIARLLDIEGWWIGARAAPAWIHIAHAGALGIVILISAASLRRRFH